MDAIVEQVITTLSSYATQEFNLLRNPKDDFWEMNLTVSAIEALLLDTEANATNNQISVWLANLKDVLYDVDDWFDEHSFEALRREVMTRNYTCQTESDADSMPGTRSTGTDCFCSIYDLFLLTAKEVRIFFSESNQVFFRLKMGLKMKEIRKRLKVISKLKKNFQLPPNHSPNTVFEYKEGRETHSSVGKCQVIIGREDEKKCIVSYLLDSNVADVPSVIAIVGIGGLGKTALAKLVYNDELVSEHFKSIKCWVCVSDDFNVKHIAQKMLGHQINGGQIEQVQQELKNKIKGERFLLVLDDVWNEDPELWRELQCLLEGAEGSKIIVTTRSTKVADIMRPSQPFMLSGLDDERSRELFWRMAFKNGEEKNLELVRIGEDIVKKCSGVPLAIRTMGSLLSTQGLTESAWLEFSNKELSKIKQVEKKIFSILKLSYNHLPFQLKNCFAYCSLFPKDFSFERQTLIQLWMAQGFIRQEDKIRSQEAIGYDYFMKLHSRSFFQDVEMDGWGEISTCKIHDLMHDLAIFVAGDEHVVVSEGKDVNIKENTHHLSFGFHFDDWRKVPTSLLKANKVRTFFSHYQSSVPQRDKFFCHPPTSIMKRSRVLSFQCLHVKEIREDVGKLKHLRYLDLSNSNIKTLPESITNLLNLQTLKLNFCKFLEVLPRDINKLVNLRHLELSQTSLSCMPFGLGQLTGLQTLTKFIVSKDGASISELGLLNNLSGSLTIEGLEHMRGNTREFESAKLLEMQNLQSLCLRWWGYHKKMKRDKMEKVTKKDKMVLEALKPCHSIKGLEIDGFCGKILPDWIGNFSLLRELDIRCCHGLEWLPESIGTLSSLLKLSIEDCEDLILLPKGMHNLKNLKELWIYDCPLLAERCREEKGEDWPKIAHIPEVYIV